MFQFNCFIIGSIHVFFIPPKLFIFAVFKIRLHRYGSKEWNFIVYIYHFFILNKKEILKYKPTEEAQFTTEIAKTRSTDA